MYVRQLTAPRYELFGAGHCVEHKTDLFPSYPTGGGDYMKRVISRPNRAYNL
jgi:hypothetical protein